MSKTVNIITLVTALLLSCSLSLRIREHSQQDECYGWWYCLLKQKSTNSKSYNYILKFHGSRDDLYMQGTASKLDGSSYGSWYLFQTDEGFLVGMLKSLDGKTQHSIIVGSTKNQGQNREGVAINKHQLIDGKIFIQYTQNNGVKGQAFFGPQFQAPLIQVQIWKSNLKGQVRVSDKVFKKSVPALAKVEVKEVDEDEYQGVIFQNQGGNNRSSQDCVQRFKYHHKNGPGAAQIMLTTQCPNDSEGSSLEGRNSDDQHDDSILLAKMYDKLNLRKDANDYTEHQKRLVKFRETDEKLVYGLRIDYE